MTPGSRVRKYLNWKGITHSEFRDTMVVSNGYIGKATDIGSAILEKISIHYPDLNLHWVITGEGNMIRPVRVYAKEPDFKNMVFDPRIPYIHLDGINTPEIVAKGQDLVSEGYIKIPGMTRCDGAVAIRGDNMYPLLKPADIVFFKVLFSPEEISWGDMHIVHILQGEREQFSVYYIHKGGQEDTVKLLSYNSKKYPAREYPLSSIRWLALVKASVYINSNV